MKTPIHTSRKLEKLIKKHLSTNNPGRLSPLGKWNANIFYVDRKKCWLITNSLTRYSVLLTNIKNADLKNISTLFKNSLYTQLIYDGILMNSKELEQLIGDLELFPTDGDRKTIGSQNKMLYSLEYWKYQFGYIENMPVKDLAHRLNSYPFELETIFTTPIDEIQKVLPQFS